MRTTILAGLLLVFALGVYAGDHPTYLRMAPGAQIDIGHGFKATNVFLRSGMVSYILGEIINTSGKSYDSVFIEITVYGDNGILLDTGSDGFSNFDKNSRRAFYMSIAVDAKKVKSYKISTTSVY
jgi:hypothetical protein